MSSRQMPLSTGGRAPHPGVSAFEFYGSPEQEDKELTGNGPPKTAQWEIRMGVHSEKREFTRVPSEVSAEIICSGRPALSGRADNISMKGVYVLTDQDIPAGTECRIVLYLGKTNSALSIKGNGAVVRKDDHGVAIEIRSIEGIESFCHLKNLVLYNAPDPEQVGEEFNAHLGIRRIES